MMKRTSRPDSVRRLKKLWSNEYQKENYLKSVTISGESHLRGIKNTKLSLEFPVSVLCGPNGAGKTTFLALSTLAFHAKNDPIVPLKNIQYFDFSYFFKSSAKEKHMKGIEIIWEFTNDASENVIKGDQRWMRYIKNNGEPRRPIRGTEFIGISRITPAFEKKGYQNYFSSNDAFKEKKHSQELSETLSRIMSRPYDGLSELNYHNSSGAHSVNTYNDIHTSFNAGAGEECLTQILNVLLNCPEGSFIAIEEIEIGLHPSTLSKLIDSILSISLKRKLQILITSHSTEFLRAFPPEGLILAERVGNKIDFTNRPNPEYAINRIGGDNKPAVCVLCEDKVAGKLISMALPAKYRTICPVVGYGGKDQLIEKALTIKGVSPDTSVVIIWDGDVQKKYVKEAEEEGLSACHLPGESEPEKYLISKLRTKEGTEFLKNHYSLTSSELSDLIEKLSTIDLHDLFYTICESVGLSGNEETMVDVITSFVTKEFQSEFEDVTKLITGLTNK